MMTIDRNLTQDDLIRAADESEGNGVTLVIFGLGIALGIAIGIAIGWVIFMA